MPTPSPHTRPFTRAARPAQAAACAALLASLVGGCTTTGSTAAGVDDSGATMPPQARPLTAAPAAVRVVDAPGLNVEDLTARLRDAMSRTAGVDVVDEISVKNELAACTEAPCPEAVAERFRSAAYIVASSISRVGDVFLVSVRVQRGAQELVRTTAQAKDARRAIAEAGFGAGAKLREVLVADGAPESTALPPTTDEAPGEGTERGGDEG